MSVFDDINHGYTFVQSSVASLFFNLTASWNGLSASLQDPALHAHARQHQTSIPPVVGKSCFNFQKVLSRVEQMGKLVIRLELRHFPSSHFTFSLYISHRSIAGPKSVAESTAAAVKFWKNFVQMRTRIYRRCMAKLNQLFITRHNNFINLFVQILKDISSVFG